MSDERSAADMCDQAVVEAVLRKIGFDRLMIAIRRIAHPVCIDDVAGAGGDALWVPYRGTLARLAIDDILLIEADRDYVRLHDNCRSYLLRATVSGIAGQLGDRFLRIHRSSLVARDRVTALRHTGKGRWVVVIGDDREVSIGRTYLDGVRLILQGQAHPTEA